MHDYVTCEHANVEAWLARLWLNQSQKPVYYELAQGDASADFSD